MNFSAGVSDCSSEKLPPLAVSQAISPFSRKALVFGFYTPSFWPALLVFVTADCEVLENPNLRLFFFTLILILKLILVSVGGCDPSCLGGIQLDVLACECYSTIKRLRGLQLSICICANGG